MVVYVNVIYTNGEGMVRKILVLLLVASVMLLNGCATHDKEGQRRAARFTKVDFGDISTWQYDDHLAALSVFRKSCAVILIKKPTANIGRYTTIGGKVKDWQAICRHAPQYARNTYDARVFFEKFFDVYRVTNDQTDYTRQFTGYYEVELTGSNKRTTIYKYPVYMAPTNIHIMRRHPKFSRESIDNGALSNKNLEIAWVSSKKKLMDMHIQGSGTILLDNGRIIRLNYHSENGFSHKTHSLFSHPKNQSYVFFRERKTNNPYGAQGVELEGERSIAVDHKIFPYGMPFWIEARVPLYGAAGMMRDYHRLMIAQDTGGRIVGGVRADIFFGRGKKAEYMARRVEKHGNYYALFPKSVKVPRRMVCN